jgi:hypothetical protein
MSTDSFFLLSWAAFVIVLQVWLFMAAPPKTIVNKYSRLLLLRSMLPFVKTWRRNVEPSDMDVIQRYRRRAVPYLFMLVVSWIVLCAYFYLRYRAELKSLV